MVYIKPFLHIVSRNQSKFSNFLSKLREISQLQIQIFLMKKSIRLLEMYTFFPSWLSRIAGFRNEDKNG